MVDLSTGAASMPARIAARVDAVGRLLGAMPGGLPSAGVRGSQVPAVDVWAASGHGAAVAAAGPCEAAVGGADVVAAGTRTVEPVVRRGWLGDGAHVCSVGLNAAGREVDADLVRDAVVV